MNTEKQIDGYSIYLMLELAANTGIIFKDLTDYDELWNRATELYLEFQSSEFNSPSKSEYECMENYLKSLNGDAGETVEESNKLMAEFLGYTPNQDGMYMMPDFVVDDVTDTYDFDEDNNNKGEVTIREGVVRTGFYPCEMEFNTNWNWIMPVIGKFSNQCEEPEEMDDLRICLLCNDIKGAYNEIVELIENVKL